ncbi:fasciclin domain-containing protein [Pseudohaliea sp.]|uniref:fasciclin domain-containing protein n=1 Tax=Pseudohaliea sp. TaxID=2740289 RepID=UPI0032F07211
MNIAKRILLAPAAALALVAAGPALADHHAGTTDEATPDIVEIAAGNEDFSTLVAALKAAGLVETLQGEGPFTVFAPTNAAFAALPDGTVESLLAPANKAQLTAVLTYHVIPGAVYASDVVELSSATTVQGGDVSISTEDGRVMIDGAEVIKTDIEAENGVIHVIDAVLLPSK